VIEAAYWSEEASMDGSTLHVFTLIAALTVASAARAQPGEGHYVGTVQGTSKAYREMCSELSVDVTIADGVVTGTTRKTIQRTGSRTISIDQQQMTGTVSSEGKGTAKLYGRNFPVDLSNGRFAAKYVSPQCDYDFDLPQVK
jgi:hypothetical protein